MEKKMDVVLCGLKMSGKTSIISVIFKKMNPQSCSLFEPDTKIQTQNVKLNDHFTFQIYDIPGSQKLENEPPQISMIEGCGALVLVIDQMMTDSQQDAYDHAIKVIEFVQKYNQKCSIHLFIHKTDPDQFNQEEQKRQELNHRREQFQDVLVDYKLNDVNIEYHMTSIYDHSIYEAFSKVIQKLNPKVPYIQNMLDQLVDNCRLEKVFLFEEFSKICLATDTRPFEAKNFAICSEMIDVFIDISCIYVQQENYQESIGKKEYSEASINLTGGTTLLLQEVEQFIVIIMIIKEENYDRPFLINHNINVFRKGLKDLMELK